MKALILVTRVPIPGKTKTRLMEILSARQCAHIHKCFLLDIFNVFSFICKDIDIYLYYTPHKGFHIMEEYIPDNICCLPQKGNKLGERMNNAFKEVFDKGYEKVVLIGSDIPAIQPQYIDNAFESLDLADVCLGATQDGGYYLVGMKDMHEEIFNDHLKWGNNSVLEGTMEILNSLDLKVTLAEKQRDIDTKYDLIALKESIDAGYFNNKISPYYTIKYVNELWSGKQNAERQAEV